MDVNETLNNERLQRAIRCLQLIQRTNPQKSEIAKAAAKSIAPLLAEAEQRPLPAGRTRKAKPVPAKDDSAIRLAPALEFGADVLDRVTAEKGTVEVGTGERPLDQPA